MMKLYIGNKNYSSWSMRSWVLMRQLGIDFEEVRLRFDFSENSPFRQAVACISPAGKVPVLVDDGFAVWDTLAIAEYLHEVAPACGVWPAQRRDRARARSLCAEMHAGFDALRSHCPMNIEAKLADAGRRLWEKQPALRTDVQYLESIWEGQLARHHGPMLFGSFSAVDAFFAPVCARLRTYQLPIGDVARGYVERVGQLAAVQRWTDAALAENDFLKFEEPYRSAPDR